MLPFPQKILFLLFALITGAFGLRGFVRLYMRIAVGRKDTDSRFNDLSIRMWYSLKTTFLQSRTFRNRPWISFFHAFIFYGFAFYMLVNLVDAFEGFVPFSPQSLGPIGNIYILLADIFSALVMLGVIALVLRRFVLPSRRDMTFNERTLLHKDVQARYVMLDSIIVSSFILFHVGSRVIGAGATVAADGANRFAPFATLVSHLFTPASAQDWRILGYWGSLGSVLLFLAYFPYSKHVHIFMAPVKYLVRRDVASGVLHGIGLNVEDDEPRLGARKLEDLAWPRLLDAYACIQCNRCQDVCPATATGKSLSPSAIEINKRMELNNLSKHQPSFEKGSPSPNSLLSFALSPEAVWACTTCGACLQVCPVQDEPMLDIIDIRRQQVMIEGEFPAQLQSAFRGMERTKNPWGISRDKRMDWAQGLRVATTEENPEPDVLYWVGCAASYDPQAQKTARAFVQLLDHAGANFAVLGKRECCTGDSARRAGNEYLYRQLAGENVAKLDKLKPKLIVATCPHCMNAIGKEYRQLGGDYRVVHHTEYLASLIAEGKLVAEASSATVAFHDPCYLGRHNSIYEAPRNILNVLSNSVIELKRNRANSFCCGAGGGQFWKEEETGTERISENRYREAQATLAGAKEKVLAVGCPFCKGMLDSTPGRGDEPLAIRDVAELLLAGVQQRAAHNVEAVVEGMGGEISSEATASRRIAGRTEEAQAAAFTQAAAESSSQVAAPCAASVKPIERKKWKPKQVTLGEPKPKMSESLAVNHSTSAVPVRAPRKLWAPKRPWEQETAPDADNPLSADLPGGKSETSN